MVEALVEFDYAAQAPDELTLKKGDVITAIIKEPGNGWWEGCLKGHRGLFPDNFVKILNKDSSEEAANEDKGLVVLRGGGSKRRCKVIFSYKPVNADELELKVNDVLEVLAEVEEGWWKGRLRSHVGVFPSNFVQEIENSCEEKVAAKSKPDNKRSSIPNIEETLKPMDPKRDEAESKDNESEVPSLPPKPAKEYCKVLFPYEAANEDELTLTVGDIVIVLSKVVQDKGWWKGELKGKIGVFPDNFVELIPADMAPKKADRQAPTAASEVQNKTVLKAEPMEGCTPQAESPTKDDKPLVPPIPGKKPQLPPPLKKPQRLPPGHPSAAQPSIPPAGSNLSAIKRISGEFEAWGVTGDSPDGAKMSSMSNNHTMPVSAVRLRKVDGPSAASLVVTDSITNTPMPAEMDFDSVERSAMLSHPTASRAKAPRRRPPSANFPAKESEGGGLPNGSAESEDTISAIPDVLSAVTANGALVEDTTKESDQCATTNGGEEKRGPPGASIRPSFMDELKLSQAKRGSTAMGGNIRPVTHQTTVHVIPSSTHSKAPITQPSPPNPSSSHQSGTLNEVAEKPGQQKPLRPFSVRTEGVRPTSVVSGVSHAVGSPAVTETAPVSVLQPCIAAESPVTPIGSSRISMGDGPTALSRRPVSAYAGETPNLRRVAAHFGSWQEQIVDGDHPSNITPQMYREVTERVEMLERNLESQSERFTQLLVQMKEELAKEKERRKELQESVSQLQSLLTHV